MNKEIRDVILAINRTYRTVFNDTLASAPASEIMSRMTMNLPSSNAVENYAWITDLFAVRRWTGERESIGGFASEYLIRNEVYEGSKAVKIVDIEDGIVASRGAQIGSGLAAAYQLRQDREIYKLLDNGFTAPAAGNGLSTIDGKALFATDHPFWSLETIKANGQETYRIKPDGTFSNKGTAVFSEDALWDAYEAFMLLVNHVGEPAEVMPDTLVVGPQLARTARRLLTASSIAREVAPGVYETEANDTAGLFNLVIDRRLGTSPRWFLFDTSSEQKPFILQNRKAPQFQINGASFDENAAEGSVNDAIFNHDELRFGVRGRFGVGYGLPYYAYGSTGGA